MDLDTMRMLLPQPYEPRDIKVNKELERGLRKIKRMEKTRANRSAIGSLLYEREDEQGRACKAQ